MISEAKKNMVKIIPSDWRFSASIVGLIKYFNYHNIEYQKNDDYVLFNSDSIDREKYLDFVEYHFKDEMTHLHISDILRNEGEFSEEAINLVNQKIKSKSILKKKIKNKENGKLKTVKFDGSENCKTNILDLIEKNRKDIIESIYINGNKLYKKYNNQSSFFKDEMKVSRVVGYYEDINRKLKSLSYFREKTTMESEDYLFFDFIPFAFTQTREAFFVNNNFTVDQLFRSNTDDFNSSNIKNYYYKKLFSNVKEFSEFIDYEVEVIIKDEEDDYYKTLFLRKDSIDILNSLSQKTVDTLYRSINLNPNSEKGNWLNLGKIVVERIVNNIKFDDLLDKMLKIKNPNRFLISKIIEVNGKVYSNLYEGAIMEKKQKYAYGAAKEVISKLPKNKIRSYEKRLVSAVTLRDYDRVQEILLQLSSYSQVKMGFLLDVFEDFDSNKNLVYTFINVLGDNQEEKYEK